jgi:hypothetical protein
MATQVDVRSGGLSSGTAAMASDTEVLNEELNENRISSDSVLHNS